MCCLPTCNDTACQAVTDGRNVGRGPIGRGQHTNNLHVAGGRLGGTGKERRGMATLRSLLKGWACPLPPASRLVYCFSCGSCLTAPRPLWAHCCRHKGAVFASCGLCSTSLLTAVQSLLGYLGHKGGYRKPRVFLKAALQQQQHQVLLGGRQHTPAQPLLLPCWGTR